MGLLTGCPDRTISEVNPQQGRVEYKDIPVTVNRDIDILFVIDDSPSMLDKQTNLKNNFPNFINVLNTIEGGLPNVHLGVVELGPRHEGRRRRRRRVRASARVLARARATARAATCRRTARRSSQATSSATRKNTDGTRTTNYTGSLAAAFSAIASLGAAGCGFEQHIEAAKRALNNNPANAGFLRPNAYLALIFIQDEDDCSISHVDAARLGHDDPRTSAVVPLQPVRSHLHAWRRGLEPDEPVGPKGGCSSNDELGVPDEGRRLRHVLQGPQVRPGERHRRRRIAGPTTPYEVELRTPPGGGTAIPAVAHSCTYNGANGTEVADPSIRLKQFLDQFPNRSTFSTICQQDLSGALTQIAQLLRRSSASPCIDGNLADVDPDTAGDQYDCSVSDVRNYGKANQTETVLPQCNNAATPASSTNKPCWSIQSDPTNCMAAPAR